MNRFAPIFVSALGVIGLALSLAYFWLVMIAFQPGGAWATNLLIGPSDRDFQWTFLAFLAPYFLLVAHLYLRTELGHWLLARGTPLDAIRYTASRLENGLMRSQKEALSHRLALGKSYAYLGRYEEAAETLERGFAGPRTKRDRARFAHWRVEIALRLGRLRDVQDIVSGAQKLPSTGGDVASFWGAVAEARARDHDRRGFDEAFEKAKWADPNAARTQMCSVLFATLFDPVRSRAIEALATLDLAGPPLVAQLPMRAAEMAAWRVELLLIVGEKEAAKAALETDLLADSRAREVMESARERVRDSPAEEE